MNLPEILFYGHKAVVTALSQVPVDHQQRSGVCGIWSAKDLAAHLSSYELYTGDTVQSLLDPNASVPTLQTMLSHHETFNDIEVGKREKETYEKVIKEFTQANERLIQLVKKVPAKLLAKPGTLLWYGIQYALDDFLIYTAFGHKHEHAAQIVAFLDKKK